MRRSGAPPRLHRLPQRLDYTLIPAPLDLAKPLVDEKSPLPAIIVTPSSPSHDGDFAIAFLMPPPKPSTWQRMVDSLPTIPRLPSQIQLPPSPKPEYERVGSCKTRARATVLLLLLLFIMVCHVVMHEIAKDRPRMEFSMVHDTELGMHDHMATAGASVDTPAMDTTSPAFGGWFDLNALWAPTVGDSKRTPDFVVIEEGTEAQ
ncbi:uncharacterized protein C8Q71DRAFT_793595 [Rhodofomes roseus]|uniref:Transmembrane protein n=1 Tax=Rhodofomes roseus TaxID=34475 RepID=A0ABQ8KY60_9APHY|nr:uncharacterized protein C8Q71DRAFT_793595 [Rhodofomes roseus]KAH9843968.1 hypothetical protein C8Q71DRAFT_793595 [Rhodofomes roseus]